MRSFLFIVLALLSTPGLTMDFVTLERPIQRLEVTGIGRVDYQHLFTEISQEGETIDAFIVRIAPRLVAYSDASGFEACGELASDGKSFGVVIGSNRSHLACASFLSKVPVGMTATGETIHSHGKGAARLNRNDLRFLGLSEDVRSQHMFGTIYGQDRLKFSERDLAAGPGYLATPQGVVHQDGNRKVRAISP